jgi:uncharacterized membrane protein YsdA (DUF1294 family)
MRNIDRLHYMDSLRAMAMFLGLVIHAAVVFAQWTIDPVRTHNEPSMFLHYVMELIHVLLLAVGSKTGFELFRKKQSHPNFTPVYYLHCVSTALGSGTFIS